MAARAQTKPYHPVRSFWSTVTRRQQAAQAARPKVVRHDPAARRPHDLDDPFFEEKVQIRIADFIAHAGHKR